MSFTDRLVLWLHVGFAIFTIGPVTVAIMSTPRHIRKRNVVIVRYLYRTTRIFAVISLGVLIAGVVLANQLHDFSKPWLTASLTLFVVAIALLVLIMRDQHRAIAALEEAEETAAEAAEAAGPPAAGADERPESAPLPGGPAEEEHQGRVERGRIASLGGVVSVIWLVILVLMVWNG
jgi:Ca2+/Na+ antiporter